MWEQCSLPYSWGFGVRKVHSQHFVFIPSAPPSGSNDFVFKGLTHSNSTFCFFFFFLAFYSFTFVCCSLVVWIFATTDSIGELSQQWKWHFLKINIYCRFIRLNKSEFWYDMLPPLQWRCSWSSGRGDRLVSSTSGIWSTLRRSNRGCNFGQNMRPSALTASWTRSLRCLCAHEILIYFMILINYSAVGLCCFQKTNLLNVRTGLHIKVSIWTGSMYLLDHVLN